MALKYTSKLAFLRFLNAVDEVPNRKQSTFPNKEEVGTGDNSETQFTFDVGNVIENSETLYYGASESAATSTLTRTTHYSIDYDTGIITLTASGVTALGTNKIYAIYSFCKYDMADTYLTEVLENAEREMDKWTGTVFYDGTAATPDFAEVTDEVHIGQGTYQDIYSSDHYPINSSTTTLDGAVSAGDTTITVVSTNGFPSSGYFGVEEDKVTYTGKTDVCTRCACSFAVYRPL